jgi:2-amino-4-hydroxy-6-hydroxymethyldihydropteridine diphosphokinase
MAAVALGANATSIVGAPEVTLVEAVCRLAEDGTVAVVAASRFYRTPAFPPGSGADYVNAAILVATGLPPEALLARLHAVEAALGRVRRERWGARGIDLDLLWMDDLVLPDARTVAAWMALPVEAQRRDAPPGLILPHPRLADRAFVLAPLEEIAPRWRHPLSGETVVDMLAAIPEREKAGIRPL